MANVRYVQKINPLEILQLEEKEIQKTGFLNAFPEFLLNYFGIKLWKTCVKHTENLLEKQGCK